MMTQLNIALNLSERSVLPFFLHLVLKKASFFFRQKKRHVKTKQENELD